jgi:ectoine hydroxylase-related dioxygenase (phytanoyl-CoA dioxygenase family)
MTTVTEEHYEHWRTHGWVIVENLLTPDELAAARENVSAYLPSWEEYEQAPRRYRSLLGYNGWPLVEFPFVGDALNHVTTHPELIAFAKRVLRTDDLVLSHSQLRGKYAGSADYDQLLHMDYSNNTLVVPKDDSEIFDLPFLTYYDDVTEDLGPTMVVSKQHTDGYFPRVRRFLPREDFPEAYEKEVPAVAPAGSTLIYSMRTFHRGSAMRATKGTRIGHHVSYRAAASPWAGQVSHQRGGDLPEMIHFLEQATPELRQLLGFPHVGDPYWDNETLAGVAARYPGMDMTPYRNGRRE